MLPTSLLRTTLAGVVLLVSAAPIAASAQDLNEVEAVRVLRTLRDPAHPPVAGLAVEFEKFARSSPKFLFGMLETGRVADRGEGTQILSNVQAELILTTFERIGRSKTLAALASRMTAPEDRGSRRASIQVLGAVGIYSDLERVLQLSVDEENPGLDFKMSQTVQDALAWILSRDPSGFTKLEQVWRAEPTELLRPMILAVGDARDPRGLPFLIDIIRSSDSCSDVAAAQINKIGRSRDENVNAALAEELRLAIETDPSRLQTICVGLGRLGDLDSVGTLIELMDDEAEVVRTSAHWALREITGLPFPADQRRWQHWMRSEMVWSTNGKAELLRRLRSNHVPDVEQALGELATHPFARPDVLGELPELLDHANAEIRILACRAIATLGGLEHIETLISVFEDEDPTVAAAALEALRELTSLDLPLDERAWHEELDRLS